MRIEFEEAGGMSLSEFTAFFTEVAKEFKFGKVSSENVRDGEDLGTGINVETYEGEMTGYFDRDYANGEVEVNAGDEKAVIEKWKKFLATKGDHGGKAKIIS